MFLLILEESATARASCSRFAFYLRKYGVSRIVFRLVWKLLCLVFSGSMTLEVSIKCKHQYLNVMQCCIFTRTSDSSDSSSIIFVVGGDLLIWR